MILDLSEQSPLTFRIETPQATWLYRDEFDQVWQLIRTGDRSQPFQIQLVKRYLTPGRETV
jgi:hypothetical protein